jgi:hypothetical protein
MFEILSKKNRSFRKKTISNFHGNNCEFIADHPILKTFSLDLLYSFKNLQLSKPITFYVGAHRSFSGYWSKQNIRIAIQTEQFSDEKGQHLWWSDNAELIHNIKNSLKNCDVFWDLSKHNMPFYQANNLEKMVNKKGVFGPYVFQKNEKKMKPLTHKHIIFCGTLNDRRKELIKNFDGPKVKIIQRVYGAKLNKLIDQSAGVLNLHFADGIYTELPRVLSAYNRRRILVSEILAAPFLPSEHYICTDSYALQKADEVFQRFSTLVSDEYNFEVLLKDIFS